MKNISIRAKLCILVLSIIVPLIILQIVSIGTQKTSDMEYELKKCEDYSHAVSSAFMNYIEGLWDTELAIGQSAAVQPEFDTEHMESYMKDILSKQKAVIRFNIVKPDGNIIASTFDQPYDVSLADREYIIKVLEGNEKVVSGIIESRLDNDIIMPVSRGIWKDGKLIYIVVAAVDVNRIGECLPQYRDNETGAVGIVDSNGMLVYINKDRNLTFTQRKINNNSDILNALKGVSVRCEKYIPEVDDTSYAGICVPIAEIGWACYDAISVDEVMSKYKSRINNNTAMFFVIISVYLSALLLLLKKFLKPIEVLRNASDAIFNGDLGVRANIRGSDDIAAAGRAFDKMAERIEHMEANRVLFLQTSTHELRNPITSIKGIVSLIHMKLDSGKPIYEVTGMMNILDREVDRLSHLLSEILEAFRGQNADWELKTSFKKVNVADVIASALKPFQASESGYNFILYTSSTQPVFVLGDPERLEDVMRNLFNNAIKYSPHKGDIIVKVETEGNHALISVKDKGIGIPKDQINQIFESFYRANNFNGNDPGGMGLGLYICRGIIKRHGGSIWAENCEEGGSTFYIKLPLYK